MMLLLPVSALLLLCRYPRRRDTGGSIGSGDAGCGCSDGHRPPEHRRWRPTRSSEAGLCGGNHPGSSHAGAISGRPQPQAWPPASGRRCATTYGRYCLRYSVHAAVNAQVVAASSLCAGDGRRLVARLHAELDVAVPEQPTTVAVAVSEQPAELDARARVRCTDGDREDDDEAPPPSTTSPQRPPRPRPTAAVRNLAVVRDFSRLAWTPERRGWGWIGCDGGPHM
jgi:hypothetical protein